MNMILAVILQLIDMVVFIACAVSLVHTIPREMEAGRWKKVAAWGIYGALALLLPVIGKRDWLTATVLAMYFAGLGYLLYFRSKMGLVCQVIYITMIFLVQYMAFYLTVSLYTVLEMDFATYVYLYALLKCSFEILGTAAMRYVIRRRFTDTPYLKIQGMVLIPFFSMILIFQYIVSSDIFLARFGYHWFLIYCLIILVINLDCLYFWYDVGKNREFKHRLELMQQQKEMTVQYYAEMEENYNNSRKIIHDIRNHLHAIEQKYRIEDRKYLDDVHAMLNSLGMKFYAGNKMLNIVLNDKLKGISPEQADVNFGGIDLDFIADIDMTTIFANLLENAVEAGKGQADYWLKIQGEEIQDFTLVKISNPLSAPYQEGKSSKPGHEGIGLQNVRQAVEKYQGEMKVVVKDNVFSVTLLFLRQ